MDTIDLDLYECVQGHWMGHHMFDSDSFRMWLYLFMSFTVFMLALMLKGYETPEEYHKARSLGSDYERVVGDARGSAARLSSHACT